MLSLPAIQFLDQRVPATNIDAPAPAVAVPATTSIDIPVQAAITVDQQSLPTSEFDTTSEPDTTLTKRVTVTATKVNHITSSIDRTPTTSHIAQSTVHTTPEKIAVATQVPKPTSTTSFRALTTSLLHLSAAHSIQINTTTAQVANQLAAPANSTAAPTATFSSSNVIIIAAASALTTILLTAIAVTWYRHRAHHKKNASNYDENMICRGPSTDGDSIASFEKPDGAVYGGVTEKKAKSGKVYAIRRLFLPDTTTDEDCMAATGTVCDRPPIVSVYEPAAVAAVSRPILSRFSRTFSRLPDPFQTRRHELYSVAQSSTYSTDMEVPFKLGSPIRSSYSVVDWRTRAYQPSPSSTPQALDSRFSDFSGVVKSVNTKTSIASTVHPINNFSRPITKATIQNATRGRDGYGSVDDDGDAIGQDDSRKTQVYKLLKRALGK